jgi:hypothetical protein
MTPDEFFASQPLSKQLFETVRREIEALGASSMRVSKSQIAFKRRRGFAWVWMPAQYLKREAAPLVLSVSLPRRDPSARWKQIVEPYPGRFMHHLELYGATEIDDEVRSWLRAAWELGA